MENQNTYSNFKANVPAAIQQKMHELAGYVLNNWEDIVSSGECVISPEVVSEIQGNYVSGWIPKQDGGFEVAGYYQNDAYDHHITEGQKHWNEEQQKDCYRAFLSDNKIESDTEFPDLTEEQQESLYEYEQEWFSDEALVQFQCFVEGFTEWKREHKQVNCRISVNYKGSGYYREKDAEDIHSEAFELDEFLGMSVKDIADRFCI